MWFASAAIAVTAAAAVSGCAQSPTSNASPSAAIAAEVCENGDGAVYAVTLGGVASRMIAQKVVEVTAEGDAAHTIAEQVVHDPDAPGPRAKLAEWVRTTCGGA